MKRLGRGRAGGNANAAAGHERLPAPFSLHSRRPSCSRSDAAARGASRGGETEIHRTTRPLLGVENVVTSRTMSLLGLFVLLAVAGICGAIGQSIAGYSRGGCLGSIALGFIGALLGTFIARWLALPELFHVSIGGVGFPIVWSIAGAALFVAVLSFFARRTT
jgi:uncharacterized membrane protein YeaQ/YmgE (transglycosylase-associated protein family)